MPSSYQSYTQLKFLLLICFPGQSHCVIYVQQQTHKISPQISTTQTLHVLQRYEWQRKSSSAANYWPELVCLARAASGSRPDEHWCEGCWRKRSSLGWDRCRRVYQPRSSPATNTSQRGRYYRLQQPSSDNLTWTTRQGDALLPWWHRFHLQRD